MMAATVTAVAVVVARSVGEVGGEVGVVGGEVSGVVGGCVLCLTQHTVGIVQTCIGISLFWSKLQFILFGMAGHAQ
jgi:hypothetical protein